MKVKISEDAVSLYNKALVLKAAGQIDAAIEKYEEAILIKPDFFEAYYNKGNALRELKKFEEAIQNFNSTLIINPDFALAFFKSSSVFCVKFIIAFFNEFLPIFE